MVYIMHRLDKAGVQRFEQKARGGGGGGVGGKVREEANLEKNKRMCWRLEEKKYCTCFRGGVFRRRKQREKENEKVEVNIKSTCTNG